MKFPIVRDKMKTKRGSSAAQGSLYHIKCECQISEISIIGFWAEKRSDRMCQWSTAQWLGVHLEKRQTQSKPTLISLHTPKLKFLSSRLKSKIHCASEIKLHGLFSVDLTGAEEALSNTEHNCFPVIPWKCEAVWHMISKTIPLFNLASLPQYTMQTCWSHSIHRLHTKKAQRNFFSWLFFFYLDPRGIGLGTYPRKSPKSKFLAWYSFPILKWMNK